jgi:hypothetical protein
LRRIECIDATRSTTKGKSADTLYNEGEERRHDHEVQANRQKGVGD